MSIGFSRSFDKGDKFPGKAIDIGRLALPNDKNGPARSLDLGGFSPIALGIGFQFRQPVVVPRFGRASLCAIVAMPKTAMNEDCLSLSRKNDVRFAGERSAMKAKTIPA